MTIELTGLTKQQYQLADLLWRCESQQDVELVKRSLPEEWRREAETVHQLMIAAVFDGYEDIIEEVRDMILNLR